MSMKKIMTTTDRHLFGTIGIDQIVNIMMIGDRNIVNLYNTRYEINKTITIHPNDIIVFCDEKNDYKWSIKINNTGEDITIEGGMHNTVGVLELDTLPDYTVPSQLSSLSDSLSKLYQIVVGSDSIKEHDSGTTYNTGDVVFRYEDGQIKVYICKADGTMGEFDPSRWDEFNLLSYINQNITSSTGEIEDKLKEIYKIIYGTETSDVSEFDTSSGYSTGVLVSHEGKIYMANTNVTAGEWDPEQWDEYNILDDLSALESDNTTNKSDISTLKTNVSSLQTDNTQNKQDITDIKQDITEINETMSTLGGNQIIVSESQPSTSGLKEGDLWIKPYPQQTITFNTLGGTPEVSTMSVDYGTLATPPSNPPHVEGYEFAYWAPAVEKYTVHFNVNGGSPSIPDQTVRIDWYPRKPPTPTKSGTSFIAWTYETTEQQAVLDYMTDTYNDDISNVTAESLESDYYNSYLNEYAGEHPELTGQVTAEAINAANERMAATPSTMSATNNTLDNITNTDIRAEDTYKAAIKVYTENDPKFVQLDMLKREFEKRKNLEEYKKKKAEEEAAKQAEENKQETTESGDPIIDAEIVSENHTAVSTNNNTESDNTQK